MDVVKGNNISDEIKSEKPMEGIQWHLQESAIRLYIEGGGKQRKSGKEARDKTDHEHIPRWCFLEYNTGVRNKEAAYRKSIPGAHFRAFTSESLEGNLLTSYLKAVSIVVHLHINIWEMYQRLY